MVHLFCIPSTSRMRGSIRTLKLVLMKLNWPTSMEISKVARRACKAWLVSILLGNSFLELLARQRWWGRRRGCRFRRWLRRLHRGLLLANLHWRSFRDGEALWQNKDTLWRPPLVTTRPTRHPLRTQMNAGRVDRWGRGDGREGKGTEEQRNQSGFNVVMMQQGEARGARTYRRTWGSDMFWIYKNALHMNGNNLWENMGSNVVWNYLNALNMKGDMHGLCTWSNPKQDCTWLNHIWKLGYASNIKSNLAIYSAETVDPKFKMEIADELKLI